MLTYNDVRALSELSDEEVRAIAEHERVPEICAVEYGYYLCQREGGIPVLHRIILDDIAAARQAGNDEKELKLRMVLRHFIQSHPEHDPAEPQADS